MGRKPGAEEQPGLCHVVAETVVATEYTRAFVMLTVYEGPGTQRYMGTLYCGSVTFAKQVKAALEGAG